MENVENEEKAKVKTYNTPSIYTKNTVIEKKKFTSSHDIEKILNNEKKIVKEENWSRLQTTDKILKLNEFSVKYCNEHMIDKQVELNKFLQDIFKRRTKKEVVYNKKEGIIEEIVGLIYNSETDEFHMTKQNRVSTSKNLPKISYSRKKKNITKKNTEINN